MNRYLGLFFIYFLFIFGNRRISKNYPFHLQIKLGVSRFAISKMNWALRKHFFKFNLDGKRENVAGDNPPILHHTLFLKGYCKQKLINPRKSEVTCRMTVNIFHKIISDTKLIQKQYPHRHSNVIRVMHN